MKLRNIALVALAIPLTACSDDATEAQSSPIDGLRCEAGQTIEGTGSNDDPWRCADSAGGSDPLAGLDCGDGVPVVGTGSSEDPWRCGMVTNDTLAGLSCAGGQLASYDGSNWQCVDPAPTLVAGSGVELSGAGGDLTVNVDANAVGTAITPGTLSAPQMAAGALPGVIVSKGPNAPGAHVRCDQAGSITGTVTHSWQAGEDGTCINAAIAYALETDQHRVYLGRGTYDLNETVSITESLELIGMGYGYTRITSTDATVDALVSAGGADVLIQGIGFELDWDSNTGTVSGVAILANRGWLIRDCWFDENNAGTSTPIGVRLDASSDTPFPKEVRGCVFDQSVVSTVDAHAIVAADTTAQRGVRVLHNHFRFTQGAGEVIELNEAHGWTIAHNRFEGAAAGSCARGANLMGGAATGNRIIDNRIEGMTARVDQAGRFAQNQLSANDCAVALTLRGDDWDIHDNRFTAFSALFSAPSGPYVNASMRNNYFEMAGNFVGSIEAINFRFIDNQVRGTCNTLIDLLVLESGSDDVLLRNNSYSGDSGSNCNSWLDDQSTGSVVATLNPFWSN